MLKLKTFITESEKEPIDTSEHKPAVIAPGRYNPMHIGHKLMISRLIALGQQLQATPVIIIVDSGKYNERNPLTGAIREKYLQKLFPNIKIIIAKNAYFAVEKLHKNEKMVPVGSVTGADRADSYKKMIGRIFGSDVEQQFRADIIHRDPESEDGVVGASGTRAREAAKKGDEGAFRALTGFNHDDSIELMELIKKGMKGK